MKTKQNKLNSKFVDYVLKQRGLCWQDIAVVCNVSKSTTSKWRMQQYCPDSNKRKLIAEFLDLPVNTIIIPIFQEEYIDFPMYDKSLNKNFVGINIAPETAIMGFYNELVDFECYLNEHKDYFSALDWQELKRICKQFKKRFRVVKILPEINGK